MMTLAASAEASITRASLSANSVPVVSSIVCPLSPAAKSMVSAPAVAFAARIASRSEIPSAPGLAIKAVIDDVSPLTRSKPFATVTAASTRRSSSHSEASRRGPCLARPWRRIPLVSRLAMRDFQRSISRSHIKEANQEASGSRPFARKFSNKSRLPNRHPRGAVCWWQAVGAEEIRRKERRIPLLECQHEVT